LHEFDRTDALRERKIPIDRMFRRDDGSFAAKPGQRDMRPKRPPVRLPEREKKVARSCASSDPAALSAHRNRGRLGSGPYPTCRTSS
jgi:hypothetical protein